MAMEQELHVQTIINNLKDYGVYKDECVRCFKENVRILGKIEILFFLFFANFVD